MQLEIICAAEYIAVDWRRENQTDAQQIARYGKLAYRKASRLTKYLCLLQFDIAFGRVVDSKNSSYPIGTRVCGHFGWRTHTLVEHFDAIRICPADDDDTTATLMLGSCGEPGYASIPLHSICQYE